MSISPDTKDWTWVLDRPCPECRVDVARIDPAEVAGLVRDSARTWHRILSGSPDMLRQRPAAGVWSPLEYGCHARDVLRRFDRRLALMLETDDPLFENWDQDATAVQDRYGEQDPARVAQELDAAAEAIADRFDSVTGAAWQRPGRRSDGARFTVESFARYFIHDVLHHLHDVGAR